MSGDAQLWHGLANRLRIDIHCLRGEWDACNRLVADLSHDQLVAVIVAFVADDVEQLLNENMRLPELAVQRAESDLETAQFAALEAEFEDGSGDDDQ